jgi:hypothetical protein
LALPGKPYFYVRDLGFTTDFAVSAFGGKKKMHTARGIVKLFGRVRQKVNITYRNKILRRDVLLLTIIHPLLSVLFH